MLKTEYGRVLKPVDRFQLKNSAKAIVELIYELCDRSSKMDKALVLQDLQQRTKHLSREFNNLKVVNKDD